MSMNGIPDQPLGIHDALDYFNEQHVEWRFVSLPDEAPDEVWFAAVGDDVDWGREFPVEETLSALQENSEDGYPPPHTIDVERSYTEWGASGAGQDIIFQISIAFLSGAAGAAGKVAWDRLRDALRSNEDWPTLDREAAKRYALVRVEAAYGIPADGLRLIAEKHDTDRAVWTFELADDDNRYEVELRSEAGLIYTGRISRRRDT